MHRSFRLTKPDRPEERVIPRLWRIYACFCILGRLLQGLLLVMAGYVGSHAIPTSGETDYVLTFSFAILVSLALAAIQGWWHLASCALATRYLAGRWMTREQAAQFPGFDHRWPASWLEPTPEHELAKHPLDRE